MLSGLFSLAVGTTLDASKTIPSACDLSVDAGV